MKQEQAVSLEYDLMKIWVFLNHNSFNLECDEEQSEELLDMIRVYFKNNKDALDPNIKELNKIENLIMALKNKYEVDLFNAIDRFKIETTNDGKKHIVTDNEGTIYKFPDIIK